MGEFQQYLNRRRLTPDGWMYFCRICGEYKLEDEFYKRSDTVFGKDYRCKIHYVKKNKDEDSEMDYLRLLPLKEQDFIDTQILLQTLGYEFGTDSPPVWIQFNQRHNL